MFINLLNPHKNFVRIDCPGSTGEVTYPRLPIWGVPELGLELRSVLDCPKPGLLIKIQAFPTQNI